jgi:hypothetical protein
MVQLLWNSVSVSQEVKNRLHRAYDPKILLSSTKAREVRTYAYITAC